MWRGASVCVLGSHAAIVKSQLCHHPRQLPFRQGEHREKFRFPLCDLMF
jgi:hypothetical protein